MSEAEQLEVEVEWLPNQHRRHCFKFGSQRSLCGLMRRREVRKWWPSLWCVLCLRKAPFAPDARATLDAEKVGGAERLGPKDE